MSITPAREVADLLLAFKQMLHRQVKHRGKAGTLSPSQVQALLFIQQTPQTLMRDLSTCLAITPPSATALVTGLIQAGFLTRSIDLRDRRAIHLKLTTRGRKILDQRLQGVSQGLNVMMNALSPQESQQFIQLLKKIIDSKG